MRIPSGSTDRKVAFVALDSTDLRTRVTGLSSFTVYRSRNGGTATAYTTPTVAELSAANMPGVYVLTIDEDTTVDSGHDVEEYAIHVTATGMAPVTRVLELERVKFTEGQSATIANSAVDADVERIQGAVVDTTAAQLGVKTVSLANDAITAAAVADGAIDAGALATGAITAAKFAAGAIDAAAIATDAIGAAELAAGAANKIRDTILSDATPFQGARIDAAITSRASSSALATVQADTDDIQARLPAALVGGRMASNAEVVGDKTGYGLADGAITSAKFAAGAIDAAAIATDAIDSDAIAASAVTEIQTGLATTAQLAVVSGQVTDVQADTDDIQTRLPAALVGGRIVAEAQVVGDKTGYGLADGAITAAKFAAGAIDAAAIATDAIGAAELAAGAANKIRDTILSDATPFQGARIDAAVTSRATPAQVNAEVLDVLTVDTFPEPAQGAPPATATLLTKLGALYKAWRNKSTQDASTYKLFNSGGTVVDQKAAVTDDGTLFTRAEVASGP